MFLMLLSIIAIFYCSLSHRANSWRMFQFNFTGFEVEFNPVNVKDAGGTIRINSKGPGIFDINYHLKSKLTSQFLIHVQFSTITKNVRLPIRVNTTFDLCELFKKPHLPPVLKGICKGVTSHMDMPLKCPIEPKMYHMTGIGDNEEDYPPYLPLGSYRINIRFHPLKNRQFIDFARFKLILILAKNNNKRPDRIPRVRH